MKRAVTFLYAFSLLSDCNQFVFGYQRFHDAPCHQISYGADAEDDEVAGFLAFKSQKSHLGSFCIIEQDA